MHDRITQLNDLIRDILGEILTREVSFKTGVIITLTKVVTARNLRSTHILLSVLPVEDRGYVMKTIQHEQRHIEWLFHKKLSTRPLPKLVFGLDTTEEKADEVERLLRSIKNE
ncbi:MAG: ribosome-binding factor A [Candidatus Moraniibacteriota bacterium]|nr:MAG: ribosome-binding factor A [Candidatus Moranbacteria bacterium]